MKALNYYLATRIDEKKREEMEKYSNLVGKKVKAIPTNESTDDMKLEEETFTIVGLTTQEQYSSKIFAVLKSEECDLAVCVDVSYVGRKREDYFYKPSFILEILE